MAKQSIARDAIKLTTSKIITMVLSMVAAMLLSRFRTLEEYGTYSQLLMVINIVTTIIVMGLPNSINYFLARAENEETREKFLSLYYTLSTILGFITGLVLVLSTPLLVSYFNNPLIEKFIYVLAVFPWTRIVLSSIDHVLIVYRKQNALMLFRVLNSISIILTIFIVQFFNLTFNDYMVLFILLESIFSLAVYAVVYKNTGKLRFQFNWNDLMVVLKFSLPIGLATVVGRLNIELDKLLIARFFSTADVAIYTNAAREMPVTIIASALTAVLMPRLALLLKEHKYEQAMTIWGNSVEVSLTLIAVVSFGLIAYAPEAIIILYSDKYLPGVTVFQIYSVVQLLRITYFGIILNSMGKTKLIFYSSVVSLVVNVILNYLFYLVFGFIGPALATIIALFAGALMQLVATSKSTGISISRMFPWKRMLKIVIINAVFAIVFFVLKQILDLQLLVGQVGEALLLGAVWSGIYLLTQLKAMKANMRKLNV